MSAPTTSPAGAAPGTATQNADAHAVASGAENAATGTQGAPPSGSDYLARVRSGGEWAVSEVQNQQRRADQAAEKLKQMESWLGGLSAYQQPGITGDLLAQHLSDYLEVVKTPEGQARFQSLREGKGTSMDATHKPAEDEYLTDEEKEIRALKAQVARLESRLTGQDTTLGQQALLRHIGKVASDWNLSDPQKQKLLDTLTKQVETWARQGDTGLAAIKNLSGPSGWETVEMMLPRTLGRDGLSESMKAQLLRDQSVRRELQTDRPSGRFTGNAEPPPEFKTAHEALVYAMENPGVLEPYGE